MIATKSVQYPTNMSSDLVFIMFVSERFSCQKTPSKYLYAKSDHTMMMPRPNTFNVIQIWIFFCEKIVFMIRIRTYTSRILVMIGRINFTMKRLNDKTVKRSYDFFCILFITDDKKLLSSSSFTHDTFDSTWCRIRYFEADFGWSFLLSRNPSRDYSTN